MGITSAFVLLAVVWWMTFLIVLPFRVKTQGDLGEVEPGTHSGAPAVHNLPKKAMITTAIALVVWGVISAIILSGSIKISEIEFFRLESEIVDDKDG